MLWIETGGGAKCKKSYLELGECIKAVNIFIGFGIYLYTDKQTSNISVNHNYNIEIFFILFFN